MNPFLFLCSLPSAHSELSSEQSQRGNVETGEGEEQDGLMARPHVGAGMAPAC